MAQSKIARILPSSSRVEAAEEDMGSQIGGSPVTSHTAEPLVDTGTTNILSVPPVQEDDEDTRSIRDHPKRMSHVCT